MCINKRRRNEWKETLLKKREMDKKNEEESKKKLFLTYNSKCECFFATFTLDQLLQFSTSGLIDLSQEDDEKLIEVTLRLPRIRVSSLIRTMEIFYMITNNGDGPFAIPLSSLARILSGRSPISPPSEEQQLSIASYERTITSAGASSSSSPSVDLLPLRPRPIHNVAQAYFLSIGTWQAIPQHESEFMVLRFDFRTRKLAWELMQDGCSTQKIEIEWSNIIGIQAVIEDHRHGIIQLELQNPPKFFKEVLSIQKKIKWAEQSDFTGGRACQNRIHLAMFMPGLLGEYYKKLMMRSKHLLEVSQKPFPSANSPYFFKD